MSLKGCEFLISLKQISKFEKANAVSINVYAIDEDENQQQVVFPL